MANSFDNYPGTPPTAPYANGVVSVGTTATLICTVASPTGVVVQNNGSVSVVLGGSAVTATGATAGVSLAANASLTIPTLGDAQCELYGITASSTANVAYLYPVA